jgi:hypothetical protein
MKIRKLPGHLISILIRLLIQHARPAADQG